MKRSTGPQAPTSGMACTKLNPRDRVHLNQLADIDPRRTAAEYKRDLTRRYASCYGVTTDDGTLIAYAIVRTSDLVVTITDLMVAESHRRKGVGTMLIGCVRKACIDESRACIETVISDANTPAHLFFKKIGFRGEVIREGDRDYYLFRWIRGRSKA